MTLHFLLSKKKWDKNFAKHKKRINSIKIDVICWIFLTFIIWIQQKQPKKKEKAKKKGKWRKENATRLMADSCIQKHRLNKKRWKRKRIKMHLARYNVPSFVEFVGQETWVVAQFKCAFAYIISVDRTILLSVKIQQQSYNRQAQSTLCHPLFS